VRGGWKGARKHSRLTLSANAEADPEAPNDHTRRVLRVGTPGKKTVTARVGVRSETLEVLVLKVQSMTVSAHSASGRSRTNPPDANDLYVPEEPNSHSAKVDLSVSVIPEEGKGYVRWSVGGDAADPCTGTALDLPKTITLTPTSGNRTFTFDVGADTNGDGENDCDCIGLTVHVVRVDVRVDSNNDGQIDDSDDEIEANAPGKVLALNNDTDNGDANIPDHQVPTGPISGEDDLVPAYLSVAGAPEDEGRWSLSFSSHVRVYLSADKTGPISTGAWAPRSTMPAVVYIEGISRSGSAGDAWISLSYELPDVPTTVITDAAALTVATVEIIARLIPNNFLVTFDDDEELAAYQRGVRQQAKNRIGIGYQMFPPMNFWCQQTKLTLRYRGPQWTGGEEPEMTTHTLCLVEGLPRAGGEFPPSEFSLVDLDFPSNLNDVTLVGIRPTEYGGRYELIVESWNSVVHLTSVPCEIEGKPLVADFSLSPDPNGFCPYTTQQACPQCALYAPPEVYWGAKFTYTLNANLEGYAWVGSLPDQLRGDRTGLRIAVAGKTLNVLSASKSMSTEDPSVKWEGYDDSIDEPAGEPFFWGPHDPSRETRANICDYPQVFWSIVPQHVVPETNENNPYRADVEATAHIDPDRYPDCRQVYRRLGEPVHVKYDMVFVAR